MARLLAPRDYGIMGMLARNLNLATLVSEAGITDAVVMFRDLTRRQIAQLNSTAVLMGALLAALSCGIASPLAIFFSTPQLRAVVMVMSTQCLIGGFQVVPRALLQKDLKFKRLAAADAIRAFSQIIGTVALAWLGFAYWSLVCGTLIAGAVSAGLMLYWRRHSFAWPHLGELHRELQFSTHLLLSRVAWYTYENADFLVAGRVLGQVPLGNYTIAWTISAPVDKVSSLVGGIAPAYFSAVQKDCVELRRYLLRMTEALSYVTVPASIGLALVADYLVPALLGPKWIGVIGPLRLLSLYIAVRSISTLLPLSERNRGFALCHARQDGLRSGHAAGIFYRQPLGNPGHCRGVGGHVSTDHHSAVLQDLPANRINHAGIFFLPWRRRLPHQPS